MASFNSVWGDKLRQEMEGGKRDKTFFSAHTFTNCLVFLKILKMVAPLQK
jgi:hypothetical protein